MAANGNFHSLTAAGDGTLPDINISPATIFTCLLLSVLKTTFPFSPCLSALPGMIYCHSCIRFSMKSYLPEFHIEKLLLDAAHDTYPLYEYCKTNCITPFIDLNPGHTGHFKYKDDFTIGENGVPVYKLGLRMHHDGVEKAKHREKYCCPLPTGKKDVSVNIPASVQNTAGSYISSKKTTPGFLTYRQGTVRNGNWNTTNRSLSNDQINAKK